MSAFCSVLQTASLPTPRERFALTVSQYKEEEEEEEESITENLQNLAEITRNSDVTHSLNSEWATQGYYYCLPFQVVYVCVCV